MFIIAPCGTTHHRERRCVPFVVGDFHSIPFPTSTFGIVYCNVLDHVFNISRYSAEVCRVLKPSGFFMATLYTGRDRWTAANGIDQSNQYVLHYALGRIGMAKLDKYTLTYDMDLGDSYSRWKGTLLTIIYQKTRNHCSSQKSKIGM